MKKPIKDGSKDIPMKPYRAGPYQDFYCPVCNSLAAYVPVGIRRIYRGVQLRCRVCNQMLDWRK